MPELSQHNESPEAVAAFLDIFRTRRIPLSLTIPRSEQIYTSYILSIDEQQLHIDQLMPEIGNQLLQPGQAIDIRLNHQGIAYLFRADHVARAVDSSGFLYHQISRPAQVTYSEKRSSYRVQPKLADRPVVNVAITPGQTCKARLENISTSGACIRLKGNHSALEFIDNHIRCEIQLVGLGLLSCEATVRHHQHVAVINESRLGIEFRQVQGASNRKLHQALMQLQRHNIRSYAGN